MVENAKGYIDLAKRHIQLGQLRQAVDNFELALRFEERSMSALCGLAGTHLKAGNLEDARRTLARALDVDGRHPEVMKLQAELHAKLGRYDLFVRAIHDATEAALDNRNRQRSGRPG